MIVIKYDSENFYIANNMHKSFAGAATFLRITIENAKQSVCL